MKYVILIALCLALGTVGGVSGGLMVTSNAHTISARAFVVPDQVGKVRAVLAVLPQQSAVPGCGVCDRQVHLIVADQQMIWPPSQAQPSAADVAKILKFLLH
jgi:hypothetical protein